MKILGTVEHYIIKMIYRIWESLVNFRSCARSTFYKNIKINHKHGDSRLKTFSLKYHQNVKKLTSQS